MSGTLNASDYAIISCVLVVSAAVGLYFRFTGGRQKTTLEYLLGGKVMGTGPVAFSLMASCMSAIALLGVPAEVYMYGTQLTMETFGFPIGSLIVAYGFLPVFFDMEVSSVYEYLEKRFGKSTRTIVAVIFGIRMVFYMAVALYAPANALNAVTHFSVWNLVLILVSVATFCCFVGGLKAVLWTDVFQAIFMYIPLIAVIVSGTNMIGFNEVYNRSNASGRLIFFNMTWDITVRYTFWNSVLQGVFFGCENFGANQLQIQRIMSIGNLKRAQKALIWSVLLIVSFKALCYLAGVVTYAIFSDCDPMLDIHVHLTSPDQIVPYSIFQLFGDIPGLPGLCLAGVLSAALSSVSSSLNSLCSVVLEDFIKPYCLCKRLSDSWMSFIVKLMAIAFSGLCLLSISIVANFRGVFEATIVLNGVLSGPTLGLYLIGLFSSTANEFGALVGLITGIVLTSWVSFGSYLLKFPIPTLPRNADGCPLSSTRMLEQNNNSFPVIEALPHMRNITEVLPTDDRYIFPLYKMAYYWFPIFGLIITVICGLIASLVARYWNKSPTVDKKYLSPFVRRFHSSREDEKPCQEKKEAIGKTNSPSENCTRF